ncbi:hypothetical protein JG688_00011303 [Phytophthora aleatoria]|uniref:Uncharacterized protein n=1 Tax=Phytophthora aleatoria TaxID=2496075 RepID=A0A8J5IMK1_9STRA|nr:hypothetical protein JG688_00011303 [Phytophthora aleatoria]
METLRGVFPAVPTEALLRVVRMLPDEWENPAAFALTLTLSIMEQLEICDQSVAVASTWLLENEWQDLLEASQEEDEGEDVTIATNVTPNKTSAAPVMTQPVGEEGEPARQGGIMVVSTEAPGGREEDFESEDEDEEDGDEEDMYYDSEDEGVSMVEKILPLAKRIKITTLREERDEIKTDDFWVAFDGKVVIKSMIELLNTTLSKLAHGKVVLLSIPAKELDRNGLWCNLDTAANNVKLGEVNKCELPVPDPLKIFDNDFARFARSFLLKNPKPQYIQITSTKRGSSTTLSTKQTLWSQYLANPALVQSEIKFDAPGLYDMETIGTGYNHKASYDTAYRAYTADTNVVNNANSDVLCGVSGIDATKNVYYTIPCSSFDKFNAKCRYTVKLSELLDVPTAFVTSFPTPSSESTNSKNYVFWRYNTDGSTFVKWDPLADTAISFVDASTTVVLEAWTACGRVNQFSFSVNLVVQNALTCSKFDSMWNFIEKYGIQGGEGAYCAYEGSDFAILKFDMAVADVLGQADSTEASTGVKCDIMVKETGAADTQVVTLVDDQISSRISKNYGVELVNNPTTAQKTTGVIHCKFTRAIQSNTRVQTSTTDVNSIDCRHTFTITDCDKPELNCGKKEDMCSVRCAGDPAPGVYEACGGSIVASSATNTFLKTPTVPTCCDKCNKPLVCTSVSTTDIKRCEPSSISVLKLETATMAGSEPNFMTTTNMALLAATITLFAVVGFTLKHRANDIEQGDYYRLL